MIADLFQQGYAMFPILIFATFTLVAASSLRGGHTFNAESMFASLSLLKLMAALVLPFLQTMITCQGAGASIDRIQSYLVDEGEAHKSPIDLRLPEAETGQRAEADAHGFELQENFAKPSRTWAFEIAAADLGFCMGQPLLHKITLAIDRGSFTMVVGKVGSGKSLLLLSLLGELAVLDGQAKRSYPDASFCSQPPWLRNVSIRDNILGESAFEADWYSSVTWACGLDQDFHELSNGDATLVGTGGMSLSGGQKNRVSLARALYARKPVVVVDDVLSGLDKTTEKLVFSRVFGRNGLLRQMQCTIVLATHSVGWAAQSDKIVVLSEGRIVSDGHYDTLIRIPGLWETHCSSVSGTSAIEEDNPTQAKSQELEKSEKKVPHVQTESEKKTEAGDDYRRKGHAGTLMYYLLGFGKARIALYIVLSIATYTSNAAQFIWVQKLVKDSASVVLFSRSISVFTSISFFAFSIIAIYLAYFFLVICPRSGLRLHARQLSTLMKAKFTALVTKDSGEITNLFSQDTIIVDRLLPILVLNISTGKLCCRHPITPGLHNS
jgi:ABC-type multidrug transport system fused ATPase/permease subunit